MREMEAQPFLPRYSLSRGKKVIISKYLLIINNCRTVFPDVGKNVYQSSLVRRRKWQTTPVSLPGEFHGHRSLLGYSPRGRKESDTTERLTHTHTSLVRARTSMLGKEINSVSFSSVRSESYK